MAKPPGRFTRRVEFWTTEAQADAIDRLNDGGLLGKADHLRLMADWYLRQMAAPRPAMNGQHQQGGVAGSGLPAFKALIIPTLANMVGPPRSATNSSACAAASHSGASCSAFESFVM
jgi:hypothetical protein